MRAKATPWHSTREQIEVAISQSPARQTLNAGRAPESRIVQSCPLPREVQDLLDARGGLTMDSSSDDELEGTVSRFQVRLCVSGV